MVGRCISYWNSPFLGGHVNFQGCTFFYYPLRWILSAPEFLCNLRFARFGYFQPWRSLEESAKKNWYKSCKCLFSRWNATYPQLLLEWNKLNIVNLNIQFNLDYGTHRKRKEKKHVSLIRGPKTSAPRSWVHHLNLPENLDLLPQSARKRLVNVAKRLAICWHGWTSAAVAGSSFHRDRRGVAVPVGAGLGGAGRRKGREARGGVDVEP